MNVNEDHFFHGEHILGEMYGIESSLLDDVKHLENALKTGITESGASLCGIQTKKFDPKGVTILALLSESHASIHTYPDEGALFFDAFTCGSRCKTAAIVESLKRHLSPDHCVTKTVPRGILPGQQMPPVAKASKKISQTHLV